MDYLKLVKVATRMLLDVVAVLEKKETEYEIGCKCKDAETAKGLSGILSRTLQDLSVEVKAREDNVVVVVPLTPSSSHDPSSEQHPSQSPLPPSPPSLSGEHSPSSF